MMRKRLSAEEMAALQMEARRRMKVGNGPGPTEARSWANTHDPLRPGVAGTSLGLAQNATGNERAGKAYSTVFDGKVERHVYADGTNVAVKPRDQASQVQRAQQAARPMDTATQALAAQWIKERAASERSVPSGPYHMGQIQHDQGLQRNHIQNDRQRLAPQAQGDGSARIAGILEGLIQRRRRPQRGMRAA